MATDKNLPEASVLLYALLALTVDERERTTAGVPGVVSTVLLLADAGMDGANISNLVRKNSDAVRKAISRARASAKDNSDA